jgi:hypothetical protein
MLLTEQQQIDVVRSMCEKAKKRIWIASPYIGNLKDVQRILGGKWRMLSENCRILTDVEAGFIRPDTFDEFMINHVEVRSLLALHAKIYIVDDWCLVTSANLTGKAFFARYEMGIATYDTTAVEETFERWWKMAKEVHKLSSKPSKALTEQQDGAKFKKLFKTPPYHSEVLDKYKAKCKKYQEFADLYAKVTKRHPQMIKEGFSLFQEIDFFFNYLYHDHPNTPSNKLKQVQEMTEEDKKRLIKRYFGDMQKDPNVRISNARPATSIRIRELLKPENIEKLSWSHVEDVIRQFHCMNSRPGNISKVLNKSKNNLKDIRNGWKAILCTDTLDYQTITDAIRPIYGFGLSSAQELIGWYYPDKYPLINGNSDCGMRLFGYSV